MMLEMGPLKIRVRFLVRLVLLLSLLFLSRRAVGAWPDCGGEPVGASSCTVAFFFVSVAGIGERNSVKREFIANDDVSGRSYSCAFVRRNSVKREFIANDDVSGRSYSCAFVSGTFWGDFDLHDFPFDNQTLPLIVEGLLPDLNLTYNGDPQSTGIFNKAQVDFVHLICLEAVFAVFSFAVLCHILNDSKRLVGRNLFFADKGIAAFLCLVWLTAVGCMIGMSAQGQGESISREERNRELVNIGWLVGFGMLHICIFVGMICIFCTPLGRVLKVRKRKSEESGQTGPAPRGLPGMLPMDGGWQHLSWKSTNHKRKKDEGVGRTAKHAAGVSALQNEVTKKGQQLPVEQRSERGPRRVQSSSPHEVQANEDDAPSPEEHLREEREDSLRSSDYRAVLAYAMPGDGGDFAVV
uniref:Intimal thickness related receptor IRP domain-containing protein n=1 Tax=Chromera velia CCMP2878 TaxID=1169474 RepID=A0A0G4HUC1_9ALVE|eukprot:Cvel_8619.t1-p1 / transcript=Cvel_8619.t1 / gene=Cvel_8619 / organism=Chromera_velia_CCMP2878 / gene_product=hypothetical protein / transcript_product=hypothetical protein / location=Cvel_scaffold480:10125-18180(+) / protein_length=409 / sequence_SO=supercontig / SO=protein_coding / is_pseudo=false